MAGRFIFRRMDEARARAWSRVNGTGLCWVVRTLPTHKGKRYIVRKYNDDERYPAGTLLATPSGWWRHRMQRL